MDRQLIDLLCAASGMASTTSRPRPEEGVVSWAVDAFDVYVGGERAPEARVLVEVGTAGNSAESRATCEGVSRAHHRMLVVGASPRALLLEPGRGRALAFGEEILHWAADGDSASTPEGCFAAPAGRTAPFATHAESEATVTALGDGQWLICPPADSAEATVLVTPHRGSAGRLSVEELWRQHPGWRRLAEAHEPAADAVEALEQCRDPLHLRIALGTWCHLSKEHVPRLLRAVQQAANPRISVELVAVSRDFREPSEVVASWGLINVPTVIAELAGKELGRIVETPASGEMETDLSALLAGHLPRHPGRWTRGDLIIAGRYEVRDDHGRQIGEERWALHDLPHEDGFLLHNELKDRQARAEVFLRVEASGRPTLAELTREGPQGISRGRYLVTGSRLAAWWRGPRAGVVRQELTVPARFSFANLGTAAVAWQWDQANASPASGDTVRRGTVYLDPGGPHARPGSLVEGRWEWVPGLRSVRGPTGLVSCRHLVARVGGITAHWWIDPRLRVPVSGRAPGKNWNLVEIYKADLQKLAAHG